MTNIQRYDLNPLDGWHMQPSPCGSYVRHSDHLSLTQALEADRDRAVAENGKAQTELSAIQQFLLYSVACTCEVARNGKLIMRCRRCQFLTPTAPQKDA